MSYLDPNFGVNSAVVRCMKSCDSFPNLVRGAQQVPTKVDKNILRGKEVGKLGYELGKEVESRGIVHIRVQEQPGDLAQRCLAVRTKEYLIFPWLILGNSEMHSVRFHTPIQDERDGGGSTLR